MFYMDLPINGWVKLPPSFETISQKCDSCGKILGTDKSFTTKGYAGKRSRRSICRCTNSKFSCMGAVATPKLQSAKWIKILSIDKMGCSK
jgi:hypothetical protein